MLMGTRRLLVLAAILSITPRTIQAQPACEGLTATERGQPNISRTTQDQIEQCIRQQLDAAARLGPERRMKAVVESIRAHHRNPANSTAFLVALREAATAVAQNQLARSDIDVRVAAGLARGLFELGGTESLPAWRVGLKSKIEAVRYLSARALTADRFQPAIRAPGNLARDLATELGQAGRAEDRPAVKRQIYRALAKLPFTQEVLDAYLAMMDQTLQRLRGGAVKIEGTELAAYRQIGAGVNLTNEQRTQLVPRLASLLHFTAARYDALNPRDDHEEYEIAERCLFFIEGALAAVVPGGGGGIRGVMRTGGDKSQIRQEVVRWIGDADAGTRGVLNDAPHNLPLGAP